jgi:lysophospholipase L1-like esterase
MKKIIILFFLIRIVHAQEVSYKWFNPAASIPAVIGGRGWNEGFHAPYDRLPARAEKEVRNQLWGLSRHAAGEFIDFNTNSSTIVVRYTVKGAQSMPQMPATGVSGVDLYAQTKAGLWNWVRGAIKFGDTIEYRFQHISSSQQLKNFRLYLPLYTAVQWMQIGVPEVNTINAIPVSGQQSVVAYGTSIMHGAYASRPGLAWTNILSRKINSPVINLGFSGNGQLEESLIDFISEIVASVYILDCMPNLWDKSKFPAEEIEKRMRMSVNRLRATHPMVPIVFAEHCSGLEGVNMDAEMSEKYIAVSRIAAQVFKKMKQEGVQEIYHLSALEIGFDTESTVDGTHPNDIGMMKYAEAYFKIIAPLLHKKPSLK